MTQILSNEKNPYYFIFYQNFYIPGPWNFLSFFNLFQLILIVRANSSMPVDNSIWKSWDGNMATAVLIGYSSSNYIYFQVIKFIFQLILKSLTLFLL